jgi:hypothetical protein
MRIEIGEFQLTHRGEMFLESLGIHVPELTERGRVFAKTCIDWTARKYHIAGAVGAALLTTFSANGWGARQRGTRAVRLTGSGRKAIGELLDLRFD